MLGVALIVAVLLDSFETVVFPRRVTRRFRFARLFYRFTWLSWLGVVRALIPRRKQDNFLSFFGPLSLLLLLAIWALGLVLGFAFLQFAAGSAAYGVAGTKGFGTNVYMSGTNFFTLGLGDVAPLTPFARTLTVVEAGIGFGFLALIISYLPVLNQSFSNREVNISLLDVRAGSPPTAMEILRRHSNKESAGELEGYLREWERWSAELMESHLSYPVLAYFRSQHDNQSWIGALKVILDISAILSVGVTGTCPRQARRTFAMARHVCVDLAIIFGCPPYSTLPETLPPVALQLLQTSLVAIGATAEKSADVDQRLRQLRDMYEPYVYSLADYLYLPLPPWLLSDINPDNWEKSACEPFPGAQTAERGDHF